MKRLHKRFLLATFCALFTATLQAADVTITVNGRVVAKPCTIQTKEANVNLGDLYTRNLQQPGSASGWHNITLSLTDCPVETSAVTAIVTGSSDCSPPCRARLPTSQAATVCSTDLRWPPWTETTSPAAFSSSIPFCRILSAALISRSCSAPHSGHRQMRL